MMITFITSNPSKAEQIRRYLNHPIEHKKLDLLEMQSLDLKEVALHKAKEAYRTIGTPVLVEDTSLVFHALGKLPGPLIKWFLQELDNSGLCKVLDQFEDRTALATVVFGLYDGENLEIFEGEIKGTIANYPKGERGFGWDSIFIPEGYAKTWGEMNEEEQKETSMRRIALKKLESYLQDNGKL